MTTPLSDERVAEMRERCEAATPGPWDYDHMHFEIHAPHDDNYWVVVSEECNVPNDAPVDQFGHQYSPDYEFIAAARTDVPDLLDEVERLRGIVQWREALADVADDLRAELGESHKALKNCDAEVVRLRARNAELVEVLRSVEWKGDPRDEGTICPICRQWWHGTGADHAPDCALDAALRGADE